MKNNFFKMNYLAAIGRGISIGIIFNFAPWGEE
jgi:hypothetical protein